MRRLALLVLFALLPVTSCSDAGGVDQISVRGAFGRQPEVTVPKVKPGGSLDSTVLRAGDGRKVTAGDLVVAHYIGYVWEGVQTRRVDNSYARGRPAPFALGERGVIPALAKVLPGKRAGSRLLLVIPPKEGYGAAGFPRLQIGGTDTLVFVMDLIAAYPKSAEARGQVNPSTDPQLPAVAATLPGKAPRVTIPRSGPPGKPVARPVITGGGPPVRAGQLVVFHSQGQIWRNGHVFESSWEHRGRPDSVIAGIRQMIPGWDNAVVGRPVGSRVLAVVPPKYGYGPRGLTQAKIKGGDTLVFVIDIIAAH